MISNILVTAPQLHQTRILMAGPLAHSIQKLTSGVCLTVCKILKTCKKSAKYKKKKLAWLTVTVFFNRLIMDIRLIHYLALCDEK